MPRPLASKPQATDRGAPVETRLEPLSGTPQLSARAYQALAKGIVAGRIESGTQLRPDTIAEQLEISLTPVREALYRLESDGLVVKLPYQGWFVREFTEPEVRELYELRCDLECFAIRLACRRITDNELSWLRQHQGIGKAALRSGDMDAYQSYNAALHTAIVEAARNSYLSGVMGQLGLQTQMLISKTIRLAGRPSRAIDEHQDLIELIAARKEKAAEKLMAHHILSALEDIVRFGIREHPARDERPGPRATARTRRGSLEI
jgi:DNA-binding GntR family transcriptional regulator